METGINDRVVAWAKGGGDFASGISLLLTFNRNVFYIRNIESKGIERGTATLVAEFSIKTKIPASDISRMIEEGRKCNYKPVKGEETGDYTTTRLHEENQVKEQQKEREKRFIRLREEFPFLGRKDCPEELAILVNRMITAYGDYMTGHEVLYEVDTKDLKACYTAARETIDPYILNRQIWEELNYYKIHGKVLGKLPEFKARNLREKYGAMNTVSLVRISNNNIPRKMSYYKKQLGLKETKNKDEIRTKMAEAEEELAVIQKILRARGEM